MGTQFQLKSKINPHRRMVSLTDQWLQLRSVKNQSKSFISPEGSPGTAA